MANQVETELTEQLLSLLRREHYVGLATVDHETGGPNINAISWVYAVDEKRIRFSVDNRSRIVKNILNQPLVAMTVIGAGSTHSITGKAEMIMEEMEGVPIKLALFELNIDEVRDVMFYGARIIAGPKFEKTYDEDAAKKLDDQVMSLLKNA